MAGEFIKIHVLLPQNGIYGHSVGSPASPGAWWPEPSGEPGPSILLRRHKNNLFNTKILLGLISLTGIRAWYTPLLKLPW